jgi:hypothetical protein
MMPVFEDLGNQVRDLEVKLLNKKDCTCQDIIMGLYGTMNNAYKNNADGLRLIHAFQLNSYFSTMDEEIANRVHKKARENIEVYRRILARGIELKVIKDVNIYMLAGIFWGLFLGMAMHEENKVKLGGKNHVEPTLEFSFRLISDAVDTGSNGQ